MTLPPVTPPAFSRNRSFRSAHCALFRALLIGTAIGASVSMAVPARAQSAVESSRTWNIPSGPLDTALARFAAEAGVNLSFETQLVAGRHSAGVSGEHTVASALARLLDGTGLKAERGTAGVFLLQRVSGEVAVLPAVKVQVAGAQLDELPEAYAGGQVARGGRLGILGNRDFMDTPFNQSSYTAELIENQQIRHVSEVMQNDPTARTLSNQAVGNDQFSIRGFSVNNTEMQFGGLAGVAPSFATNAMAEAVERVEVFKGPNALLNGAGQSGSVGGAINLVPKRAGDEPLTRFTVDYASESQFGGHVDAGQRFGADKQFGVRFNGVHRDGDLAIDHQSRRASLAAMGLDYRGEALRLSLDLGHQKQNLQGARGPMSLAAGVPVPSAPDNRTSFSGPAATWSESEIGYGVLRGEYDVGESLTLFAAAGGNRRAWRSVSGGNGTITDVQGNLTLSGEMRHDRMYSRSQEAGLLSRFDTGPIRHQMALVHTRLDWDWRRATVARSFEPSNIYAPIYGPKPDLSQFPGAGDLRKISGLELSSTALADTLSLLDERVQLMLGARIQRIDNNVSYDKDKLTPLAGIVVKPRQNLSLYANYIEGLQQGAQAPNTAENAGEVFDPYVTKQYELGGKLDFGGFATTLALYQIAQPSGFVDPATNIFGVDGEQRHRGVDFNFFGEVVTGVRLLGGIAYIDSELTKTQGGVNEGKQGRGVPEWRAIFGAEWDAPFVRGLTLTGRATRNGSMFVDAANTRKVPHWTLLDFGARYRFERTGAKAVTLRADLNNVLDENYWDANGSGQLILSNPRTFRVSATFDF